MEPIRLVMQTFETPLEYFRFLYDKKLRHHIPEQEAAVLATASTGGKPSARVVLIKKFDEQGFVFYTNLRSRKARELYENPQAALCFYWEEVHHQVRVEGTVEQIPDAEADAYFATRPRGSQIGAWASRQSAVLESRSQLEQRVREYEQEFAGKEVPRPEFWSGFRLRPESFEFWERRENRLHERVLYVKDGTAWKIEYLYP